MEAAASSESEKFERASRKAACGSPELSDVIFADMLIDVGGEAPSASGELLHRSKMFSARDGGGVEIGMTIAKLDCDEVAAGIAGRDAGVMAPAGVRF